MRKHSTGRPYRLVTIIGHFEDALVLTAPQGCGKAPLLTGPALAATGRIFIPGSILERVAVVKPEWGVKRACPKCNTRFYDLGKDDPVTCNSCGTTFIPEPYLKSKQSLPFETAKAKSAVSDEDDVIEAEYLDLEAADAPANEEDVDIGGDEDLGLNASGNDDEV